MGEVARPIAPLAQARRVRRRPIREDRRGRVRPVADVPPRPRAVGLAHPQAQTVVGERVAHQAADACQIVALLLMESFTWSRLFFKSEACLGKGRKIERKCRGN